MHLYTILIFIPVWSEEVRKTYKLLLDELLDEWIDPRYVV